MILKCASPLTGDGLTLLLPRGDACLFLQRDRDPLDILLARERVEVALQMAEEAMTPRRKQAFKLMLEGRTTREIAKELGICYQRVLELIKYGQMKTMLRFRAWDRN